MEDFRWTGFDDTNPAHIALQGFLVMDIQDQPELAEEITTAIKTYLAKTGPGCEGCGNAYEFECTPEGFDIMCLYDEDELKTLTADYQTVLTALAEWAVYCEQGDRDQ